MATSELVSALREAEEAIKACEPVIADFAARMSEEAPHLESDTQYVNALALIRRSMKMLRDYEMAFLPTDVNSRLRYYVINNPDAFNYTVKKETARSTNSMLREMNFCIAHPETGEPCLLFAVGNRDGTGRYVLENRKTKKRSGSYKTLADLLPVKLAVLEPKSV